MSSLHERVAADLAQELPADVAAAARQLAEDADAVAVLFYGSVLRTGKLDDLLDFYVLTDAERAPWIWPRIGFHALAVGRRTIRAKVATMPLSVFADAASGRRTDTTIWTRFCQPSALAWARDAQAAANVADAVAAAIVTAARYAAVLGAEAAEPQAFWTSLFDRTYVTEFRIEAPGRSAAIVAHAPAHYADLLPLAWAEAGIAFMRDGATLRPEVPAPVRRALMDGWRRRARLGKPLNILRLLKAALTLRDAGGYALWKIERHTGVHIEATRWRREHPVLAAPGVLWQLSRARAGRLAEHPRRGG
jgi:hypothetical protein